MGNGNSNGTHQLLIEYNAELMISGFLLCYTEQLQ